MTQFLTTFENLPAESTRGWGFEGHGFALNQRGELQVQGHVYEFSGQVYPRVIPWICGQLGNKDTFAATKFDSHYPPPLKHNPNTAAVRHAIEGELPAELVSDDPIHRLRLSLGHTMEDICLLHGTEEVPAVDLVFTPTEPEQLDSIIALAEQHRFVLVPVGGATNVCQALFGHGTAADAPGRVDAVKVAVSTASLTKILSIDEENEIAHIQAGAIGRDILHALEQRGWTLGHEPDSIEFSTLGGWIATRASGMKKNRYGNIEDILVDATWHTPQGGVFHRTATNPRESVLLEPNALVLGSEGRFGIISSAVLRIRRKPEVVAYDSVAFQDFSAGFEFMRSIQRSGAVPASVRLVDSIQFQFSQLLKPTPTGLSAYPKRAASWLQKFFISRIKGFDVLKIAGCTIVYEGTAREVATQKRVVSKLARRHRGVLAGTANAKRGYALTFTIAYLRDFLFPYGVFGESFETSVKWSDAPRLWEAVDATVKRAHAELGLPGVPILTLRATQVYHDGVTLYFYLGITVARDHPTHSPIEQFAHIEHCAREEILAQGGSLSHHHGVGQLRRRYLPADDPRTLAIENLKQWFDPHFVLLD